jgi:hypothetical protein
MSVFLTQIAENTISAILKLNSYTAKSLEVKQEDHMSFFLTQIAENPISAIFN